VLDFKQLILLLKISVVELKAVSEILDIHATQIMSYSKATGLEVGLILNFGKSKLEIRRVIKSIKTKGKPANAEALRSTQRC